MRKYAYHVYTPMGRPGNLRAMTDMLAQQNVFWHPLYDQGKLPAFDQSWISGMEFRPPPEDWLPNNWGCNCFILDYQIDPNDRYINLNDDDFVEPDFFDKVDQVEGDVLVVGMKRGDQQPADGLQYGTSTLEANQEYLRLGQIGGEQIVCSGKELIRHRYGRSGSGDWSFISSITAHHPVVFVPHAWVWFNFLEKGRWNGVAIPLSGA